jgi:hypothetical protein
MAEARVTIATLRGPKIARGAIWVVATLAIAFYLFQYSTLAPNHTDEGLILQYIDDMAHGQRPFYDFVDSYGLLNWPLPVAFYKLFGHRVWGVRIFMLLLKLGTIAMAYVLVHRLTVAPEPTTGAGSAGSTPEAPMRRGRFWTAISTVYMTVLLGEPWQSLQTAYAFHTTTPLIFAVWYLVLCAPLRTPAMNVTVAGVLTAMTIWTKLNAGMYLFAGGLFAYFVWLPLRTAPEVAGEAESPPSRRRVILFRLARFVAGPTYLVVFVLAIRKYLNFWFFVYLVLPLAIFVLFTLFEELRRGKRPYAHPSSIRDHLAPFFQYLSVGAGLTLSILVGYYGRYSLRYIRELAGILRLVDYTAVFPELGGHGLYVGLNEYYWLQLPWLVTALFVVWAVVGHFAGPAAFGDAWPRRRAQITGLFLFATLHTFVIYARSDETHVFQALVVVAPVVFVFLAQFDAFFGAIRPFARFAFRLGMSGLAGLYVLTIAVLPTFDAFRLARTDWHDPKFEHLRYRPKVSPYVRDVSLNLYNSQWDEAEDLASAYVRSISLPGEEILLLTQDRLIYYESNTRPVGGRYHYYFYLASVGLLDRAGFDALVPQDVIRDVLLRPPRVIISAYGFVPLAQVFPEFQLFLDRWYEHTRSFRHILVYELRIRGEPVAMPFRSGRTTFPLD